MTERPLQPVRRTPEGADTLTVSRKQAAAYERLDAWYANREGLFRDLGMFLEGGAIPVPGRVNRRLDAQGARSSVENLRNAVPRIVEFYATVLLTGSLEDALSLSFPEDSQQEDSGERHKGLKAAIEKLWEFSNFSQTKQVYKRYCALYGQVFIKVVKPDDRDYCYLQVLRPAHVTDFETDRRSNVRSARIDVPDTVDAGTPAERAVWRSEVYSKDDQEAVFATVERSTADTVPSERALREAADARVIPFPELHGADFVPLVAVNAADTGEKRPGPVYGHGLHLMAWINREATRLSDLLFRFNKAFKAVVGVGNDPQGRPMAPPRPEGVRDLGSLQAERDAAARGDHTVPFGGSRGAILDRTEEDISIEGVAVTGLPGNAQIADISPNIDYASARAWISDHLRELHEECPELLYYAVEARANQSGDALRTLISGAISRAEEMQANLLAGLVKAQKMALTVAQNAGIDGFAASEIGTYEGGGFEHSIEPPEVLPKTEAERRESRRVQTENAKALMDVLSQLGVPQEKRREVILEELGLEELAGAITRETEEPREEEPAEDVLARARRMAGEPRRGEPPGG